MENAVADLAGDHDADVPSVERGAGRVGQFHRGSLGGDVDLVVGECRCDRCRRRDRLDRGCARRIPASNALVSADSEIRKAPMRVLKANSFQIVVTARLSDRKGWRILPDTAPPPPIGARILAHAI